MDAAISALGDYRLRWLINREEEILDSGKVDRTKFKSIVNFVMKDEIERWLILNELERCPLTIKELSKATSLDKSTVVKHIIALISI